MYAEIDGNEVKLYGTIWEGDANYILRDLKPLLNQEGEVVTIHIHSPGGSVFDGNIISNALRGAKATVEIMIDGIAASMGGIISLASKKTKMVSNGFIMIHAPWTYTSGSAKELGKSVQLLTSIENEFVRALMARTKKKEPQVRTWLDGDNWFSAEQALALGLIDEIVDPIMEETDFSAFTDMSLVSACFAEYDQDRNSKDRPQPTVPKSKTDMNLQPATLVALGLKGKPTDAEIDAAIIALNDKVSTAESRATTAENALNALKAADKASVIDAAIKAGKFPASEKAQWEADYDANPDMTKRLIDRLPVKASLPNAEKPEDEEPTEGIPADRKNWTKDDWRKKDPAGMLALKKSNPAAYNALWNQ